MYNYIYILVQCPTLWYTLYIDHQTRHRNVSEELAEDGDKMGAAVATAQTKLISQVCL